jgi:outer membrane protein TolC
MTVLCLMLLKSCDKAPKYKTPPVQTPPAFKELTAANFKETDGWKFAKPNDNALKGNWWEIFNDPQLNLL